MKERQNTISMRIRSAKRAQQQRQLRAANYKFVEAQQDQFKRKKRSKDASFATSAINRSRTIESLSNGRSRAAGRRPESACLMPEKGSNPMRIDENDVEENEIKRIAW